MLIVKSLNLLNLVLLIELLFKEINMLRPQKGFVLVSVLIITSISTLLAFHEISNNRLQERIGGNQQKEINARMKAEKGVVKAYEYIQIQQLNNVAPDAIAAALSGYMNSTDVKIMTAQYSAAAITFVSEGNSSGAIARLDATINLFPGRKVLTGIVGCNGLDLTGGVIIDSFDSTKGAYKQDNNGTLNYGDQGNAATIKGNITLNGSSPVYGNVSAGGTFDSSGSSIVMGNVSANGNVIIDANTLDMKDREGKLFAEDIGSVNGNVNSGGSADLKEKKIAGDVNAKGEATGTLHVAGTTTAKDGLVESAYQGPNIDTTEECDNIGLGPDKRAVYDLLKGRTIAGGNRGEEDFFFNGVWATNSNHYSEYHGFKFTSGTAEVINPAYKPNETEPNIRGDLIIEQSAVEVDNFLGAGEGVKENVHVFNDFTIKDQILNVSGGGNVNIVVKGDFTMENAADIKVEKGTSLSIVVLGKIHTSDGTNIIEVGSGDSVAGKSAVSIYSVFNPDAKNGGVLLNGTNINASINAPYGDIKVSGAGHFYGAMRGNNIIIDGGAGIHFDEKLLNGKPPLDPNASIAAITYHYE